MVERLRRCSKASVSPNPSSSGSQQRGQRRRRRLYPDLEHLRTRSGLGDSNDDDNGDNVSYESEHSEGDTDSGRDLSSSEVPRFKQNGELFWDDLPPFVKYPCLLIFIVLSVYLIYLLLLNGVGRITTKEITPLKRYRHEIANILKKNFTNEYRYGNNTKSVLLLIGEKWIDQVCHHNRVRNNIGQLLHGTEKKPDEPYVVLITGRKADALAVALVTVFSNIIERGEIDRIFCTAHKERLLLESEIRNSLSKPSKAVILHGIHKLRGNAPLCLHSFCDPDHAPFPSALIFLTIGRSFGPHPACEDEISSHLVETWRSEYMNEDQIRPILSRISSYVICLQD